MSVEEDIGGLKADMRTVKNQTSKIFDTVGDLSSHVIEHTAKVNGRISALEDQDSDIKTAISSVKARVNDLEGSRTKAKWYLLGIGGGSALGGVTLLEFIKNMFRG